VTRRDGGPGGHYARLVIGVNRPFREREDAVEEDGVERRLPRRTTLLVRVP